jgi:hypothetical protein
MKFGNKNNAKGNGTHVCQPYTCEEKIPTGMEQVAGKPSWCSKVANVHLTKHTVVLVYMCVSPYN